MKQLFVALLVSGLAYSCAEAQTTQINTCGVKNDQVCKMSSNKKTKSCYRTQYAENFKVCKGNYGYYICCETPGYSNSTHPPMVLLNVQKYPATAAETNYYLQGQEPTAQASAGNNTSIDMVAPQSQSYPRVTDYGISMASSYEGYYPGRSYIKVCYTGDNVGQLNNNPYHGCPSPQSEGPAVNNQRNLNVSNPINLPPVSGRPEE